MSANRVIAALQGTQLTEAEAAEIVQMIHVRTRSAPVKPECVDPNPYLYPDGKRSAFTRYVYEPRTREQLEREGATNGG
jgi:hypothetical protein